MKNITIDNFLGSGIDQIGHVLNEAATGNEAYCVKSNAGSFVIVNEADYRIYVDAFRMLAQNATTIPNEWLEKFKTAAVKDNEL